MNASAGCCLNTFADNHSDREWLSITLWICNFYHDHLLSDVTASLTSLFFLLTASNDGLCSEARELKINSSWELVQLPEFNLSVPFSLPYTLFCMQDTEVVKSVLSFFQLKDCYCTTCSTQQQLAETFMHPDLEYQKCHGFFFFYLCQEGYVFADVCSSVCLW